MKYAVNIKRVQKSFKVRLDNSLTRHKNIEGFKPTVVQANNWFKRFNKGLFKNQLPNVEIEVKRLAHDWGRCIANWDNRKCRAGTYDQRVIPYRKTPIDYKIELHCKFPKWKDFIETLAHEMVHLYQMTVMEDPYSNHNKNFYSFRKQFKKFNLRLYR